MGKVTIAEWYTRVNDTWLEFGEVIPTPTRAEAENGMRRLWRFATGETFTGRVVFTSGNRYTAMRGDVLTINPNSWDGERGMVHSLSHWAHYRLNRGVRPHGAVHARIEISMIKEVIKRGWLGERPPETDVDKLLKLCPVTMMDAACELDCSYRRIQGLALSLVNSGRARWYRKRLVLV